MKRSKFEKLTKEAIESLKKYRDCCHELLSDDTLNPNDYRYHSLNDSYTRVGEIIGIITDIEKSSHEQFDGEMFGLRPFVKLEEEE